MKRTQISFIRGDPWHHQDAAGLRLKVVYFLPANSRERSLIQSQFALIYGA